MAGIEYGRAIENWFNPTLPLQGSPRLVVGTFDLEIEKQFSLYKNLKSAGLGIWEVPEGAYSTIYFWSPVDEDLSTRIRARWYRKPVELEYLEAAKALVNPDQIASLEVKVTFPAGTGKEYEIKYRQRARLDKIFDISKSLQDANDVLGPAEQAIPREIFIALDKRHPSGFVPTVMVSARRDHFVIDADHPDSLRVTVDSNYRYHSFWGALPWEPSYIGGYPNIRIEVKVADENLLEQAKGVIDVIRQEGGFVPEITKHADQTFVNNKYSKSRFPIVLKGNLE